MRPPVATTISGIDSRRLRKKPAMLSPSPQERKSQDTLQAAEMVIWSYTNHKVR